MPHPSNRIIRKRIPLLLPIRQNLAKGASLNSYALINSEFFNQKKKKINYYADVHQSQICLAGLSRNKYRKVAYYIDYPFYKALRCKNKKNFTKEQSKYLQWLMKKSCWKNIFLTKSVKELASLGIVYSVKNPAFFVVQGAMLARYVAEFPNVVMFWNHCAEYVDGHIAIAMAHSMHLRADKKTFRWSSDCTPNSNHQAWKSREVGPTEIKKIISCSPNFASFPPMSERQDYRGMNVIWNGKSEEDINELFPTVVKNTFKFPKESCKEEKKVEAWGSSNVFARSGARIFEISNMKKIVKEFCKINKLTEFYHG